MIVIIMIAMIVVLVLIASNIHDDHIDDDWGEYGY
jgi:hypothetical protein